MEHHVLQRTLLLKAECYSVVWLERGLRVLLWVTDTWVVQACLLRMRLEGSRACDEGLGTRGRGGCWRRDGLVGDWDSPQFSACPSFCVFNPVGIGVF